MDSKIPALFQAGGTQVRPPPGVGETATRTQRRAYESDCLTAGRTDDAVFIPAVNERLADRAYRREDEVQKPAKGP
jgi:hypothetical protein